MPMLPSPTARTRSTPASDLVPGTTHRLRRWSLRLTMLAAAAAGAWAADAAPQPADAGVAPQAVQPAAGRPDSAAPRGGKDAAGWLKAHETLCAGVQKPGAEVVFIGDSITQNWLAADKGYPVWKDAFKPKGYANIGLSGDKTQHILWRIQHGALGRLQPKLAVVLAGINNIAHDPAPDIAAGVKAIVTELRTRLPTTRILLLGLLPKDRPAGTPLRAKIAEINTLIATCADGQAVTYADTGGVFLDAHSALKDGVTVDGLHPSTEGYRLWAGALQPLLDRQLAR